VCAVQDWRRVTALVRASVQCVRLVVPRVERTRPYFVVPMRSWTFVASGVAKKFSRFELDARLRRSFSYRLITHIFARLVLPLSFATAVAHGPCSLVG
jgi:hypothetical protein